MLAFDSSELGMSQGEGALGARMREVRGARDEGLGGCVVDGKGCMG